ncbi:MAG: pseudouridine synthase [Metamycoplasmataceae bacterium]
MINDIRVQKYISQAGVASRREAEKLIIEKKVKINAKIAELGDKVNKNDKVFVNNVLIKEMPDLRYYLLNKPKKTICTLKDNLGRTLVTSLINDNSYLFPVGRLDFNTTGVLIITNDGDLAAKLTHPSYEIPRVYRARLNEKLTLNEIKFLNSDKVIVNEKKSKQEVLIIENRSYQVTLHEGSYHHVKKIFETVGKKVIDLKRVSFGGITCEKLMVGEYRNLKPFELKKLKLLVENKK